MILSDQIIIPRIIARIIVHNSNTTHQPQHSMMTVSSNCMQMISWYIHVGMDVIRLVYYSVDYNGIVLGLICGVLHSVVVNQRYCGSVDMVIIKYFIHMYLGSRYKAM